MGDVIQFKTDTLRSLVSGLGDPMRDKMASSYYGAQCLDDHQLLNAYRSTWLARKIVDIPAMDSVRKGRDWQARQDQIELVEAEEKRLGLWQKLLDAQIKARLWGGAAIYIGTGDQNPSEPLVAERVSKGGLKYLTVLHRREISAGEIDQDALSETYGRPKSYQVMSGNTSIADVHPSRLAVFVGAAHPDPWLAVGVNKGWGDSALESVFSAVRNADATAANIASLVFEANVDVFRIPDFMSSLSDPSYEKRIMDRFALAAAAKGINKALLLDKDEEYDRKTVSFAQLPEVMQTFLQMVSGASDIPVTRLLGQSPAGMNSTGTGDMKNYHDRIQSMQNLQITPAIHRLDECLIRSALGTRPPEIYYSWSPLEQMSEKELAEIGKMNAETAQTLATAGLFTAEELRAVVTNQMVESGFYPGLDQTVAKTDATGSFDLGEMGDTEEQEDDSSQQATDAAPRTLYVSRKVLNADEVIEWAKGQGFKTTLPTDDLHVTIAYSREPVDWMKVGESWAGELKIAPGGPRLMEQFNGGAAVLLFKSAELDWRHQSIIEAGATWDWPEYQSHITISYEGPDDLSKVEPYQGEIILGPEVFEEVKEDVRHGGTPEADATFR